MKSGFLLLIIILNALILLGQESSQIQDWDKKTQIELPYDRFIQPAGQQVVIGDPQLESHALDCSLSPEGIWLAILERNSVVIINTGDLEIVGEYDLRNFPGEHDLINCYSGITWIKAKNKYYIIWSVSSRKSNESYIIKAEWNGSKLKIVDYFNYKSLAPAKNAIPNEMVVNFESGRMYLYGVLNGNNQVIKQDINSKDTIWIQVTGVAPYGITKAKEKLYITNWGGGIPDFGDKNVAGVPWGSAKVDSITGATREGTVTVLNMNSGTLIKEIKVGLHPNDIISDPDENFIYLTNSNSDNVSVINTLTDEVTETISVRLNGEENKYFGDSPNGLGISQNGKILYVANGMDNAIAVVTLGNKSCLECEKQDSRVSGFIPTAAYPSSVVVSNDNNLYVTNLESEGARIPTRLNAKKKYYYNVHHMLASVSKITIPTKTQLENYTNLVIVLNQLRRLSTLELTARPDIVPKPVPDRIGEPSVFKHVVYIIRENRTYDQVLGDVSEGDGDPALCIYGSKVTPNIHKLVNDFTLLDNFFVSGKCSADGHQWTDASFVSDYIEKNMAAWLRSYPHIPADALVYSPTGFIWNNALKHDKTVRIYGETAVPIIDSQLTWKDIYKNFNKGIPLQIRNITAIDHARKLLSKIYPGYQPAIPDILRADAFIKELKHYESFDGDQLPELMILSLPNDHTIGSRPDYPTPKAMLADNDLALGQIVEAITKSRFWENAVIFIIEDDSQDGWDHVSAYRSVATVISPYSRIKNTISTRYNQPSVIRTIEQILGIPPMNIQDAIAPIMFECFNERADLSPYEALPNQYRLDKMNPPLTGLKGNALKFARQSMEPQFNQMDSGFDEQLNRILWFAAKGNAPHPEKLAGDDQ